MYVSLFVAIVIATRATAHFVPESGSDWRLLRPEGTCPKGSRDSVPFSFGIVVTPHEVDSDGLYVAPEVTTVVPITTTVLKTATVVSIAMPTKTADVVQIVDGQVQRPFKEPLFDEDCSDEEDLENLYLKKRDDDEDEHEDSVVEEDCDSEPNSEAPEEDCEDDSAIPAPDDCDEDEEAEFSFAVSCVTDTTLLMTLHEGVLRDSHYRIGSIVSSRQFQFDGPVPQYGTIYAAGWLITKEGKLCLGDSTLFYQCSSGDFYNLYDSPIAPQCSPVSLDVVELLEC